MLVPASKKWASRLPDSGNAALDVWLPATAGPRTVLVTGSRGRLGVELVLFLRALGWRVYGVARSSDLRHGDDFALDVTDAQFGDLVEQTRPDTIIHLASALSGTSIREQNSRLDTSIASAAAHAGVGRIVFASSGAIYGTAEASARREDSELSGRSAYALSKLDGEARFRQLTRAAPQTSVVSLRIFNVVGPSFQDSLVWRLARASVSDPVTLRGPNAFVRDYVHQSDVLQAIARACAIQVSGFLSINVGTGCPVSSSDLLALLDVDTGSYSIQSGEPSYNWADTSLLERTLGVRAASPPTRDWLLASTT
jgi:UDP-glucose 4-epimerase